MNRKAAEMSLNVIIIAVILLVVLVVLVIIFSGKIGSFQKGATQTEAPYKSNVCDVPGTGNYCSSHCFEGDSDTGKKNFNCTDLSRGVETCCCCKFA